MSKQNVLIAIKTAVQELLKDSSDQTEVKKHIHSIHKHFQDLTEITGDDSKIEHLAAIPTAKGKALGLNHAAKCLLDYKRTVKFLIAMVAVIKEKQKERPDELVKVFYAGCGPYAPFISLIAPLFSPEEVQFSLLEINPNSLASAKKLIKGLGLTAYIQEYYLADAVTFTVPNPEVYQVLFSETLDALLYRECYVPIVFNLLPQFDNKVTLIPENVQINLSLSQGSIQDPNHKEKEVGTIIDVRKAIASHPDAILPVQLPDKRIDVLPLHIQEYTHAILDTQVQVYDTITLDRNESSLTLPLQMELEQPFNFKSIVFTYMLEPEIELKYGVE